MRFTTAVSVLAQSVSLAGAGSLVNDQDERKGRRVKTLEAALLEDVVKSDFIDNEKREHLVMKEDNRSVNDSHQGFEGASSKHAVSNNNFSDTDAVRAPRPAPMVARSKKEDGVNEKPLVECNPDVGIFSCDTSNTRCIDSEESSLGGFCVKYQKARSTAVYRNLQDGGLCEDIYVDCDCTNVIDGVGSYTCTRPDECIDRNGQVCGTFEDVIATGADGSYSTSLCFVADQGGAVGNAFDGVGQYCYTVVNDGSMTTQCTLEIDKIKCKSCTPTLCPGGSTAATFDCTNIDLAAFGDSCTNGLNVLDLLSGALTPRPTPPPSPPAPTDASTPLFSPEPTSEPTSGGKGHFGRGSVLMAATIVALAAFVVA